MQTNPHRKYRRVSVSFNKSRNAWQINWVNDTPHNGLNLMNRTWIAGMPKRGYSHLRPGQFVPAPHKFFDLSKGQL